MLSIEHELLVKILRDHPETVLELLRAVYGVEHHGAIEVVQSPENLTELRPAERRADAVLVLRSDDGSPRLALVLEIQLQIDADKRRAWPAYVTVLRARLDCPVSLVVVTLDEKTREWCTQPIELDDHGSVLRPRVIGPKEVPRVDDDTARRWPELGVVSVLAHAEEPAALEIGRAVLRSCAALDDERRELYTDVVLSYLNEAARRALEAEMSYENFETQSAFLRERWAKAVEQGRTEALASAVLTVLQARGLSVTEDQRATLLACTDPEALETWLERAATAITTDELFAR